MTNLSAQCQLIVNEDFKPSMLSHSSFHARIAKDVAGNKQLVQMIKTILGFFSSNYFYFLAARIFGAQIFKLLSSPGIDYFPGIDSKESVPSAFAACDDNPIPSRFPIASIDRLKIPAQSSGFLRQ
jgi:hypothetical protein